MYSKLLLPIFSIFTRGLILGIILVYVIALFYGLTVNLGSNIISYVSSKTGLIDRDLADILGYITPLILLILVLPFSLKGRHAYMAILSLISYYSLTLLHIMIAILAYTIYYEYVYNINYQVELITLNTSLALAIVTGLLTSIYPRTAISFKKVVDSKTIGIGVSSGTIELKTGETLRIIIYGEEYHIAVSSEPRDSMILSDRSKTITYTYIDIVPASTYGGYLNIYYKDKLVYKLKCIYKEVNYRKIKFYVHYNDDLVGEYEVKVEDYKDLLSAFTHILDATIAKLGIERDDIREIQFYTEDDVFIPSTTKIRELEVDKVKAKIYAREKILELLRYYGKKDVYELWDTLIRRLEFLREKVSWLIKELDTTIEKSHAIIDNWW